MKIQIMLLATILVNLNACGTSQIKNSETQEEKVISRIDELKERPEWFKESEVFSVKNGFATALGSTTIPGDHRVDAGVRIAQNNAKAGICTAIEQNLDFVFQNAEEGTESATQARFIGSEACKLSTSSIRLGKIYWEKVATTKDSGERVTQYRIFATATMTENELKNAIIAAAQKHSPKKALSDDFAKKVDQHWNKITETPERSPASE